jgi:hypothetical protein
MATTIQEEVTVSVDEPSILGALVRTVSGAVENVIGIITNFVSGDSEAKPALSEGEPHQEEPAAAAAATTTTAAPVAAAAAAATTTTAAPVAAAAAAATTTTAAPPLYFIRPKLQKRNGIRWDTDEEYIALFGKSANADE